jgi:hypothetical protein
MIHDPAHDAAVASATAANCSCLDKDGDIHHPCGYHMGFEDGYDQALYDTEHPHQP